MKLDAIFYQDTVEVIVEGKKYEYHIGELCCRVAAGRVKKYKSWFPEYNWESLINTTKNRLVRLLKSKSQESNDEVFNMFKGANLEFISGLYGEPFMVWKEIIFDGKEAHMIDKYNDLNDMISLLILDLVYAIDRNVKFKRCTRCDNVFIAKVEGTMYCNASAGGKGCKRDAKKVHMEKIKADPLLNEYEKLYQTVYHQKVRQKDVDKKRKIETILADMREMRNNYMKGKMDKQVLASKIVNIRNAYCVRKVDKEKFIKNVMEGVNENDKIIQK